MKELTADEFKKLYDSLIEKQKHYYYDIECPYCNKAFKCFLEEEEE